MAHRFDPRQDNPPPLPYPPENPVLSPVRSGPFAKRSSAISSLASNYDNDSKLESIQHSLQKVADDVRTTLHEFSSLAHRSKDNGEQLQLLMTEIRGVREDDGVSQKLTGLAQLDRLAELARLDNIPPKEYFTKLERQLATKASNAQELAALESKVELILGKIDRLARGASGSELQSIDEIRSQLAGLATSRDIKSLTESHVAMSKEIRSYSTTSDSFKSQLSKLATVDDIKSVGSFRDLQSQLAGLASAEELKSQLSTLASAEELKSQLSTLATAEELKSQLSTLASAKELKSQLSTLASAEELKSHFSNIDTNLSAAMKPHLETASKDITTIKSHLATIATNNLEMQGLAKSGDLEEIKSQLQTLAKPDFTELKSQLEELAKSDDLNKLKSQFDKLARLEDFNDLRSQLVRFVESADFDKLEKQIQDLANPAQLEDIKSQLKKVYGEVASHNDLAKQLAKSDDIHNLANQLQTLAKSDDIDNLEKQVEKLALANSDDLKSQFSELRQNEFRELQGEVRAVQDHMLAMHQSALVDLAEVGELRARHSSVEALREQETQLRQRVAALQQEETELKSQNAAIKAESSQYLQQLMDAETRFARLETSIRDMTLAKYKGVLGSSTMAMLSTNTKENVPIHPSQEISMPKRQLRTVSLMDRRP